MSPVLAKSALNFLKNVNNFYKPFFLSTSKTYFNPTNFKINSEDLFFSFTLFKDLLQFQLKWTISTFFWIKARFSYYTNNWIYTTNHKRIAVNYFWFVILAGIVGMVLATIIRLEFAYPGVGVLAGDSIQYLSLASAHGVIMVFFMIMPLIFGAFSNFLLPTQLGVHDVAFPRLNSAAFWFLPGGLLMLCQLVCVDRRYQRMNCFNIREVQSLLKRKFFVDLINSKDHHSFLDNTAIGMRFKLNSENSINSNVLSFYNYGLDITPKVRSNFYNLQNYNTFDDVIQFKSSSFLFKNISYFSNFNLFSLFNKILLVLMNPSFPLVNFSQAHEHTLFFLGKILQIFINFFTAIYSFVAAVFSSIWSFFSFIFMVLRKLLNLLTSSVADAVDIITSIFHYIWKNILGGYRYIFTSQKSSKNNKFSSGSVLPELNIYDIMRWMDRTADKIENFFDNTKASIERFFVSPRFISFKLGLIDFFYIKQFKSFFCRYPLFTQFSVNWEIYRFNVNLNFDNNAFYINTINIFKIALNNIFSAVSLTNIERPHSFFTLILTPANLRKKELRNHFNFRKFISNPNMSSESLFFELYIFLFILFSLPLYACNLFAYLMVEHFSTINYGKLAADSISWCLEVFCEGNPRYTFHSFKEAYAFVPSKEEVLKFYSSTSVILKKRYFPSDLLETSQNYLNYINNISFQNMTKEEFGKFIQFLTVLLLNFSEKISSFFSLLIFSNRSFPIFEEIYFFISNPHKIDLKPFLVKFINERKVIFVSEKFSENDQKNSALLSQEELSETSRHLRFTNPVFKYDYKSGDYFPKLYKEAYTFLVPSILDLTSGLRTSIWFFSPALKEMFENTLHVFVNNFNKSTSFKTLEIRPSKVNKISHNNAFYNFFCALSEDSNNLNIKWVSLRSLNIKFQKFFFTSSLQQRIYSNWRQLKFTRESWRCKLLATRHQKTLFRRYMNEDGIFWSIERNAKDLIPGWAMITPFSSRTRYTAIGKTDIGLMGVLLVLNSSIISGANFLVTYRYLSTLNNRKMRDARAFFTEAVMVASWMMILANPMLVIGIIMLLSDRHWQTSFFDYSGGGDTVLFQHMFWFFGHPEVYVIIIPTFGFTNTVLSYYLRKRVSARASLLYSLYTIAFLGFFVWGHHMYMVGLSHTTRMLFSTLTVMISVPAATKIMHWCVTIANSSFNMELPLLFTFTFIFFFVSGGISGMCVAHTGMDVLFHDTFYVIAHFHVMLAGGAMFACFGAFYFYFPAIFGVKYSRIYAYMHYTYYLLGQLMTVVPMFWLGYAGMPRRVLDYPASFGGWHSVISAGHMLNVAGLMAFFIMIFDSLRQGRAATRNNFGINRYNTRLSFYFYEISRLTYIQQKSLFFYKFVRPSSIKLNNYNFKNYEPYESVLFSYVFLKK